MKYKVKIAILSFFISILSILNMQNGLIFKITDNTERDAVFSNFEQKTTQKEHISTNLANANIPALPKPKYDNINLFGREIPIYSGTVANSKLQTPYSAAAKYSKMIYGHRTTVFGGVMSLGVGSTFTVTLGGQTATYRVVGFEDMTVDEANANNSLIYNATYRAYKYGSYDLTLMTCTGTIHADGSATHRRVVMAKRV